MKIGRRFLLALTMLWLPVLLLLLWWFGTEGSTSTFFPPLATIVDRLRKIWLFEHVRGDLLPSLRNLLCGYALAAVAGIAGGALLWRFRLLALAAEPVIFFLYALPSPALVPAVILVFGINMPMKVFIIFFACLWPVLLNAFDGMRSTDGVKLDVAATMRMSTWSTLRRVVLPAAAPQIFAGLRTSLAVGIILMVVSEFSAATEGIGYFIFYAQQTFATVDMWTGVLVLAIAGSILNLLFVRVERRILAWHHQARTALDAL
jgi:sulfonate transport system permease protein